MIKLCMRLLVCIGLLVGATHAAAADGRAASLRKLTAPEPVSLVPLESGVKTRPVRLAKVLIHPEDGAPWALVYSGFMLRGEDAPPAPADQLLTWDAGRVDGRIDAFGQVFENELKSAGFSAEPQESLFGETGSADLQVGVKIDDLKARFCMNCPNIFQRDKVSAVAIMKAHWEVYSTVRGKVVARVDTDGGVTWREPNHDSVMPVVLAAFRDNVRRLISSEEFRKAVAEDGRPEPTPLPLTPIRLNAGAVAQGIAAAPTAVALVFGGDAMGSAFLVSSDGYLITNHHVARESPVLRLRWADGRETTARVLRSDARRDVALLKVDDTHGHAPLAVREEPARLGEAVFAVGTPLDVALQSTVTKGVVSATRTYEGQGFIQSDVAVDHGNSGGPLLDESGRVLGITQWGYAPDGVSHNLNFFIPIGDALATLGLQPAPALVKPAVKTSARRKSS